MHTFKILPKRWNVERSFSWIDNNRRNCKNYKRLNQNECSYGAFIRYTNYAESFLNSF
jgi:transposase